MINTESNNSIHLRGGLSISLQQMQTIQKCIERLVDMVPAKYVLVVDTSGQVVTSGGDKGIVDQAILGSLIAADMAASQEIARITGEFQEYQMILREGNKTNIIISEAGKHLVLLALFSKETPIGWSRALIQKCSREIGAYSDLKINSSVEISPDEVDGNLPELFNDALDQIWKE